VEPSGLAGEESRAPGWGESAGARSAMVPFPPLAGARPPSPRRFPAGSPVVQRWSWDGADRLLTAKIRP
jgi:hypothetical protein